MKPQMLIGLGILGYVAYSYLNSSSKKVVVLFPDGTGKEYTEPTPELDDVLMNGGEAVIMQDGATIHRFTATQFMGGWLFDNCPLNVIFGKGWLPGQQEALASAGLQPYCS